MSEAVLQLTVRTLAGLVCAAIGAFFGALVIAMLFSTADSSELWISVSRLAFVAACSAVASRVGWYGTAETVRQSFSLVVISALAGLVGSWLALTVAGAFFEHTDVYVLNRDISGAGFFGAAIACNMPSLIFAARLVSQREI